MRMKKVLRRKESPDSYQLITAKFKEGKLIIKEKTRNFSEPLKIKRIELTEEEAINLFLFLQEQIYEHDDHD